MCQPLGDGLAAGDERLPAEGRWDPVVPLRAVASPPRHDGPHHPVRRARRRSTPRIDFRVERVREPVLLPRPGLAARIDGLAREVGRGDDLRRPDAAARGSSGGSCAPRRTSSSPTVPRSRCRAVCPGRTSWPGACAARRRRRGRGGEYPAREVVHAAGEPVRGWSFPRASTSSASGRSTPARAPMPGGGSALDPNRPLVLGREPARAPQGLRRRDRRRRGARRVGAARDRGRGPRPRRASSARAPAGGSAAGSGSSAASPTPTSRALYACADVFAMVCRDRWLGLEAEGFGIVFLEAAAVGVPSVAGRSGGVARGGGRRRDRVRRRSALGRRGPAVRSCASSATSRPGLAFGAAARARAVAEFSYDTLATRLARSRGGRRAAIDAVELGSLTRSERYPSRCHARCARRGGGRIIEVSWAADALFAVTAIPVALGVTALEPVSVIVALGLFLVSLGVWTYAFGLGLVRSARGDNVAVANLFLLQGSAPTPVQAAAVRRARRVSVAIALATGFRAPAGFLVPMLPLGLAGMWAARHGTFPARGSAAPRPARSKVARSAGDRGPREGRSGGRAGE